MKIRISKFFETDFTIKINVKKERLFDRPDGHFEVQKYYVLIWCTVVKWTEGLMRHLLKNSKNYYMRIARKQETE